MSDDDFEMNDDDCGDEDLPHKDGEREEFLGEIERHLKASGVRVFSKEESRFAAECLLASPVAERGERTAELYGDDPEILLSVFQILRDRWETDPAVVRDEAEYFYRFLEMVPTRARGEWKTGRFVLDEREYLLGEAALIAGTTCRFLSRRDEARRWFGRAEGWFLSDANAVGDLARVNYQQLALLTEERRFDEVLERLPALLVSLEQQGMLKESLKCRILEGNIFREQGRRREAVQVFQEVCRQAREIKSDRILASGYVNLAQIHGELSEAEEAIAASREAMPILRRLGNRIDWAKVQCGLGLLYRSQGNTAAAIEGFRSAQMEFEDIQMRADVAALHLVVADLLLEGGQDAEARREVEAALPAIEEYKLVPEGIAALSLLRQSLQNPRINQNALRQLHGYFPVS